MKNYVKRMLAFLLVALISMTAVQIPQAAYAAKTVKAKSIVLNHSAFTLKKGKSLKLKAVVAPKKAKNKTVVWKSSRTSVATVSAKGVVKAKKKGSTKITATVKGTKVKAVCQIHVGIPVRKITVKSKKATLDVGKTVSIKASVEPKSASNKKVDYKSSNPKVASVNSKGKVAAKKTGTAKITVKAKDGSGKKATVSITVKAKTKDVAVTAVQASIAKSVIQVGEKTKASVKILPTNATSKSVSWSSSASSVASVGQDGTVTGIKAGKATITAASQNGKKGSIQVTVENKEVPVQSLSIMPSEEVLGVNDTLQLQAKVLPVNATNKKITFQSSNLNVALVNANGLVTAIRNGETLITASSAENPAIQAVCRITVGIPVTGIALSETEKTIAAGRVFSLTASVTPENASNKKLVWVSSDESVATVQDGTVTTKKDGAAVITAQTTSGKVSAVCNVMVETIPKEIYLDKTAETLAVGEELQLKGTIVPELAGNKAVTWSSSDSSVASVENGKVTGRKPGKTTVTVKTESGLRTASCDITVGAITETSTFAELREALESGTAKKIICNTMESGNFEIAQSDYSGVMLTIHAPNATVTNHAVFDKIEVSAISGDTWIEEADGNLLGWLAKTGHVIVKGDCSSIQLDTEVKEVKIEMDGTLGQLTLDGASKVSINGINHTEIPVKAREKGAFVSTSIPVALEAQKDITLQVRAGAETSSIQIADETVTPVVQGIGAIPVTNQETGQTIDMVAENIPGEGDDSLKGTINGLVYDEAGQGIFNAELYLIPYRATIDKDNLDEAIAEALQQGYCYQADTDAAGKYVTPSAPYGNYLLIVKAEGKKDYFQTVILNRESVDNEAITMTVFTEETGNVQGTLYDAFDASRVPAGIALLLREGADNVSGEIAAETITDENGSYLFENLSPGTYTIQVVDNREDTNTHYVRITFNVVVLANATSQENMTITKVVDGDQIRFVLTWGKQAPEVPEDLDSHLIGPSADQAGKFHTYYGDKTYYEDGVKYADLDVDDTSWEGPETTTVYQAVDGLYHFYVYDFTNQDDSENPYLASSQALVNIYIGNRNIATYHVPNEIGTLWDVCTYDIKTNVLTPINKVYFHPGNSEDVGTDPLDRAKESLASAIKKYQSYDYGSALAPEIAQKIEDAKQLLKEGEDVAQVSEAEDGLRDYFRVLENSTAIEEILVDSEEVERYSIYRQGEWYSETEEEDDEIRLAGYSVIRLTGYGQNMPENITVSLNDGDAIGEWKDSDRAEFKKLYVVTNHVTKAVEKYYVDYREYVPNLKPDEVEEDGNYIVDTEFDYDGDTIYYDIYGENETLRNPVFYFENSKIQYSYEPSAEPEIVGKLTVTYKNASQVFLVRYTQRIRNVYLRSIAEPGNVFANWDDLDYDYIDIGENSYRCYWVYGYQEILGKNGLDQVQLNFNVVPDLYEITADPGSGRTHKVTVTYKGKVTTLYLDYHQDTELDFLPRYGSYQIEEDGSTWREEFNSVTMVEYEGKQQVRLLGYDETDFLSWDSIQLEGGADGVDYQILPEGERHILLISSGGTEVARYPVYYERYLSFYKSGITFDDPGNEIVGWDWDWEYDDYDDIDYEYCVLRGKNANLGMLDVQTIHDGLSVSYEPIEGSSKGIGKLTFLYMTQKRECWVRYVQYIE